MVIIEDVAAATGVSTATVSRALRGLNGVSAGTRDRVLRAAQDLGYVPSSAASGLASGRTMAMGVLLPLIERWYFSAVLEGVDRQLRAAGYDLIVFSLGGTGTNRERVFHRSILRKRIDALLVMCMELTEDEHRSLRELESPTIVVGGSVQGVRHVSIDDAAAVRDAVRHLISLGHRKIGHVRGGGSYGLYFEVPRIREESWLQTMAEHGLPVREEWSVFGDFRFGEAKLAVKQMLSTVDERPTALFCSSDEMAFGALTAAAELGIRVPEELSIIGIDDHEFSEPMGLTTVRQMPEEQGAFAVDLLLGELAGQTPLLTPPAQPHELILRSSTGPVPA
ncbi:LacI family DNA-binding transcriptional regulator [Arthrobacter sp. JZ12]|uniref:LacI family DNA-binding transcriptional regulator n=1 Tax=Arthrobacter sp. JZ12 TaxID=2654190 RepID=UPI002B477F5E|nr:LacI family DNA-binding transcriptional regulator [Arthrobacter sp. JZ12]WRH23813.1 LacI family DNA-binding transcriptional regulator [Arthrobacter sp. JZ12]